MRIIKNNKLDKKSKDNKNHVARQSRPKWPMFVLILAGFVIFVLLIFFAIKTSISYSELRSHREYFMQKNAPIQDWMTIHSIVRRYNLTESEIYSELNVTPGTLVQELGIDNSTVIDMLTVKTICEKKHLDCKTVVDRLNEIGKQ